MEPSFSYMHENSVKQFLADTFWGWSLKVDWGARW